VRPGRPARSTAVTCTNTSFEPSLGWMKPKPFCALNHFTVPVAILVSPRLSKHAMHAVSRRATAARHLQQPDFWKRLDQAPSGEPSARLAKAGKNSIARGI